MNIKLMYHPRVQEMRLLSQLSLIKPDTHKLPDKHLFQWICVVLKLHI